MSTPVIVVTITLLLGMQPMATDVYLPSLPTIRSDLATSIGAAQLTLSVLILCFGIGQLVWGPLSDRFGRRPVLLAGVSLYTIASALCASAPSIELLVAARGIQGLALASAVTCARAIPRDLYEPHEGARVTSLPFGFLGLFGISCPMVGGAIAQWAGWRTAFLATTLYGLIVLAILALKFRETLPRSDPSAVHPAQVMRNWRQVLSNRTFRAWTAVVTLSWGGYFFMLGGSFTFIHTLGQSRLAYGVMLGSFSFAYILGTMACRRLLSRHDLRGVAKRGACWSFAGSTLVAGLSLAGVTSVFAVMLPMLLFVFAHGIHQPCGQAGLNRTGIRGGLLA